jgi:hypothetical protein
MKMITLKTISCLNANLRNPITHAPSFRGWFVTLLLIVCFAFCPMAQAVNPPLTPDPPGSLPVSNTADGQNALLSVTTGIHNTAIGFDSLLSNTDANFNTAVGSAALLSNGAGVSSLDTPDGLPVSSEDTATGAGALLSNILGVPKHGQRSVHPV